MNINDFTHSDQDSWEPPFDSSIRSIANETISPTALERIKSRAKALKGQPIKRHELVTSVTAKPTTALEPPRRRHALLSLAVTSAAILLLMLGVLFLGSSTQNQAYAQMAIRLNELNSFVYHVCQVDEAKLDDLESVSKQKLTFMAPSLYRSTDGEGLIQISNAATRQSILLDTDRKEARRLTLPDRTNDEMTPLAFVERLRSHFLADRDSVRDLSKRVIDGKMAIGFQSDMHGDVVEVWIDPETKLPVEVRMRAPTTKGIPSNELAVTWVVFTGFQYNVELDEKLLAVEVPKGYREVRTMTASVKALSDRFDRFVAMLRKCAEHNDSVFPTSLKHADSEGTCYAIVAKVSREWAARRDAANSYEEGTKIAVAQAEAVKEFLLAISDGLDFLKLPQDKLDFHYFPGARLNQPNRPVAWFTPDGKETYRVLYADLIVRETEANSLPGKPEK